MRKNQKNLCSKKRYSDTYRIALFLHSYNSKHFFFEETGLFSVKFKEVMRYYKLLRMKIKNQLQRLKTH